MSQPHEEERVFGERDRQIDTDRHLGRHRDRQTSRQTQRQRERDTEKETQTLQSDDPERNH